MRLSNGYWVDGGGRRYLDQDGKEPAGMATPEDHHSTKGSNFKMPGFIALFIVGVFLIYGFHYGIFSKSVKIFIWILVLFCFRKPSWRLFFKRK